MIAYKRRQLAVKQAAKEQQEFRNRVATAWIEGAAGDPTVRGWTSNASSYARTAYAVANALVKESNK